MDVILHISFDLSVIKKQQKGRMLHVESSFNIYIKKERKERKERNIKNREKRGTEQSTDGNCLFKNEILRFRKVVFLFVTVAKRT